MLQTRHLARHLLPIVLLALVFAAGCAPVRGNYPTYPEADNSLSEKFKSPLGHDTRLVWVEEGELHGFLSLWRDTSERAEAFRKLAQQSGLEVHREGAEMFDKMSKQGLAELAMFVFFTKGTKLSCGTGDFEIEFDDGTKVRDSGILRYEPRDTTKPYRYSRDNKVTLSDEPVGAGEPLPVMIFVAKEHLGKRVVSVSRSIPKRR